MRALAAANWHPLGYPLILSRLPVSGLISRAATKTATAITLPGYRPVLTSTVY